MPMNPFDSRQLLLTVAIALFPFYVFPSGGLQPSHVAFLLLSLLTIHRYGIPGKSWLMLLALFTAYSFMIEAVTGLVAGELRHLMNAAFFAFNFLLVAGIYQLVQRVGASALATGVLVAVAFAVVFVYLGGVDLRELGEDGRPTGTFNNPNQLGFFSVCVLSLTYLLYLEREIRFPTMAALLGASLFLAIVSLSKAAIIANVTVFAFALRPRARGWGVAVWIALALAGIIGVVYLASTGYFEEFLFYDRITNMANERDSSLVERGYLAFVEGNFFQILFGMGSLEVYRIVGHEVHSTFASVWNTYGVVGFVLFLPIFVIWGITLNRAYGFASMIVLLGPAILYGITHNGARFSIFWLLLAASMAMAQRKHLGAAARIRRVEPSSGRAYSAENSSYDLL